MLARCKECAIPYRLLGQSKLVKSFGISLSLIDFTLSRLDTGSQTHPRHSLVLCLLIPRSRIELYEVDKKA